MIARRLRFTVSIASLPLTLLCMSGCPRAQQDGVRDGVNDGAKNDVKDGTKENARGSNIDGAKWQCATDGDCMNSCALGAVNRTWYSANASTIAECEDGCDNQLAAPPRCEAGSCVAYQNDPSSNGVVRRHDYCTKKKPRE